MHEVTHLKPVLAHVAPGDVDIEELLLHLLVGTPSAYLCHLASICLTREAKLNAT